MKNSKRISKLSLAHTALFASVLLVNSAFSQTAPELGAAETFAVLAGSTVTNTGATSIVGDVGVSPGTAITGFPPGVINSGVIHANDGVAAEAQGDLLIAYNHLAGQPVNTEQAAALGSGMVLTPGVYHFTSAANLTGSLVLDAQGDPNALFIFQIEEALTVANDAEITLINGGVANNVYWQMGTSATLGTNVRFIGNMLAGAGITMNTGAEVIGRALAQTAVTLDTNNVTLSTAAPGAGGDPPAEEEPPVNEVPPGEEEPPVSENPSSSDTLVDMNPVAKGGIVSSATLDGGARTDQNSSYRSSFSSAEHIVIEGELTPESQHLNEALDVFFVVHLTTPSGHQAWFYKNLDGVFIRWDGVLASLQPAFEVAPVNSSMTGIMHSGSILPGSYRIYIGYQAEGSSLIYSQDPIVVTVTE